MNDTPCTICPKTERHRAKRECIRAVGKESKQQTKQESSALVITNTGSFPTFETTVVPVPLPNAADRRQSVRLLGRRSMVPGGRKMDGLFKVDKENREGVAGGVYCAGRE